MSEVDRILDQACAGRPEAAQELARRLYGELRELARRELAGERADHTLQPTALVHEAYLRLLGPSGASPSFENRAHFFGAAASAIRRVLVDHAREKASEKRGGAWKRQPLEVEEPAARQGEQWIALDAALEKLAALSPTKARIVELRFFAGMTHAELARVLATSEATVRREWRLARAWLRNELEDDGGR